MGVTIMHFNGLTDKQVEESRKKYGSNVIPDSDPTTFWAEFKETFKDPMIRILLAMRPCESSCVCWAMRRSMSPSALSWPC